MKKKLTPKQIERIEKKKAIRKAKIEVNKLEKSKYKEWARIIKERANYVCQICGADLKDAKPTNCQAMHLLSKENWKELMYEPRNGLLGCYRCHNINERSSHHDGIVFSFIIAEKYPEQFEFLKNFLITKGVINVNNQNT